MGLEASTQARTSTKLYTGSAMSIFIDSGAFIAYYNKDDQFHKSAIELFEQIESNEFGYAITSDYIIDEATARVLIQLGKQKAIELGERIFENYPIIHIDSELLKEAWKKFVKFKPFTLTDCTNLVIMENHNLDYIFTFDGDFKNFVKTIGPK